MNSSPEDQIIDRYNYTQTFKDQVVFQVLYEGRSKQELVEAYQLPSVQTITMWIRHYKQRMKKGALTLPAMSEQQKQNIQGLQRRVKELEKTLEEANILIFGLNTMIDYSEKELGIRIRKKRGTKQ